MKSIVLTIQPKQELIIPLSHYHALQGLVYELISYDSALSMELHNKKSGKSIVKNLLFPLFVPLNDGEGRKNFILPYPSLQGAIGIHHRF